MKRLSALSVLAVAVGLLASATAHAGLEIDDASTTPVHHADQGNVSPPSSVALVPSHAYTGRLTQEGTPPSTASAPIKGWAKDLPLVDALKQIVPDGWRARRVGNYDVNQPVSWKGGASWTDVLDAMAETYGFNVVVNWDTKEVVIKPATPMASAPSAAGTPDVKTLHASSAISSDGIRVTSVTSTRPIGSAPSVKSWTLSPKMTLRENIEAWAKSSGWTLSWGAVDYPIVASVTLQGEIDADDGPIATVMKAYEDAEQPLVARVSVANHVIRVENRDYEQTPVTSTGIDTAFPNLRSR